MTSFQLPSAIFPDNAIKRAERAYQKRSIKKPRLWRDWLNRIGLWAFATIATIILGSLLVGSLTQHDPISIMAALGSLPNVLILFTLFYHFMLMLNTMSLAANSIVREKESKTWEMLVLTGIDARQIV